MIVRYTPGAKPRRLFGRIAVMVAMLIAALGATAAPASANNGPQWVAWYNFYGIQPSWHCNNVGTYDLGSRGTAYIQACISISGQYEQGLYDVRFTQTHNDVQMRIQNYAPVNPPYPGAPVDTNVGTGSERICDSAIVAHTTMNCFAQTIYDTIHMYAKAIFLVVDGLDVNLGAPVSGPNQVHSPES